MTDPHTEREPGEPQSRPFQIALVSGSVLLLELALIRQVPAEVRAISYFTNLMLMASFFGLGLGCMLQSWHRLQFLFPLGLALIAAFVYFTRGLVVFDEAESVHYWLLQDHPIGIAPDLPLFPAALLAFCVSALPFVALGQRLALAMNAHPRLHAYGWDILGSLLGTLLFVAASAARVPPWVWPPLLSLVWAALLLQGWRMRAAQLLAGALFLVFHSSPYPAEWSPYYFVQHAAEPHGIRVWVNSSFHQFAANLDPKNPELAKFRRYVYDKFGKPYESYRALHAQRSPESVLILGAGTGNDVNIALHNGAKRIVAVEIDPAILELGKRENPTHPYADPRVHAVIDDARHYLRSSDERFDLVVFGTLDSQTLLSSQANLRLENYVYTQESFRDVKQRLAPRGMVVAYYSIFKPWLSGRLYSTICSQFPGHCTVEHFDAQLFDTIFLAGPELDGLRSDPKLENLSRLMLPSTDDWPFLYLEQPTIAPIYLKLIGSVLALIAFVLWRFQRVTRPARPLWNFLFLGMGFTLMESAAVVRLALLFGSTWVVNAVVFSAVLAMVFAANVAVQHKLAPSLARAFIALLVSIVLNYAIEPALLVGLPAMLRVVCCAALIGTPVFFASVCFSRLFEPEPSSGYALGINLVGAMAGGFAEYASMLLGMRAVWLIVLLVYMLAFLTTLRSIRGAATSAVG